MKNKGMYIEELIKNTINYYLMHNIALFEKRNIPIKISSINKNKVIGYLSTKSFVDFVGLYKGKHIEFESKQTNNNFFSINQILTHQLEYLIKSSKHGALSFFIIHFFKENETYAINVEQFMQAYKNKIKKKRISIDFFRKNAFKLNIIFPGILEILNFIDQELKKYSFNN